MQGEVSYREPDDESTLTNDPSDLESGIGASSTAASGGARNSSSGAAKKALLFTSIVLFVGIFAMLLHVGNDRAPTRYDADLPTAPHESNNSSRTRAGRAEPVQGRVKGGGIFSPARQSNIGEDVNDETEDIFIVTPTWIVSTSRNYLPVKPNPTTKSIEITEMTTENNLNTTEMTIPNDSTITIESITNPSVGDTVTLSLDQAFFDTDDNIPTPPIKNHNSIHSLSGISSGTSSFVTSNNTVDFSFEVDQEMQSTTEVFRTVVFETGPTSVLIENSTHKIIQIDPTEPSLQKISTPFEEITVSSSEPSSPPSKHTPKKQQPSIRKFRIQTTIESPITVEPTILIDELKTTQPPVDEFQANSTKTPVPLVTSLTENSELEVGLQSTDEPHTLSTQNPNVIITTWEPINEPQGADHESEAKSISLQTSESTISPALSNSQSTDEFQELPTTHSSASDLLTLPPNSSVSTSRNSQTMDEPQDLSITQTAENDAKSLLTSIPSSFRNTIGISPSTEEFQEVSTINTQPTVYETEAKSVPTKTPDIMTSTLGNSWSTDEPQELSTINSVVAVDEFEPKSVITQTPDSIITSTKQNFQSIYEFQELPTVKPSPTEAQPTLESKVTTTKNFQSTDEFQELTTTQFPLFMSTPNYLITTLGNSESTDKHQELLTTVLAYLLSTQTPNSSTTALRNSPEISTTLPMVNAFETHSLPTEPSSPAVTDQRLSIQTPVLSVTLLMNNSISEQASTDEPQQLSTTKSSEGETRDVRFNIEIIDSSTIPTTKSQDSEMEASTTQMSTYITHKSNMGNTARASPGDFTTPQSEFEMNNLITEYITQTKPQHFSKTIGLEDITEPSTTPYSTTHASKIERNTVISRTIPDDFIKHSTISTSQIVVQGTGSTEVEDLSKTEPSVTTQLYYSVVQMEDKTEEIRPSSDHFITPPTTEIKISDSVTESIKFTRPQDFSITKLLSKEYTTEPSITHADYSTTHLPRIEDITMTPKTKSTDKLEIDVQSPPTKSPAEYTSPTVLSTTALDSSTTYIPQTTLIYELETAVQNLPSKSEEPPTMSSTKPTDSSMIDRTTPPRLFSDDITTSADVLSIQSLSPEPQNLNTNEQSLRENATMPPTTPRFDIDIQSVSRESQEHTTMLLTTFSDLLITTPADELEIDVQNLLTEHSHTTELSTKEYITTLSTIPEIEIDVQSVSYGTVPPSTPPGELEIDIKNFSTNPPEEHTTTLSDTFSTDITTPIYEHEIDIQHLSTKLQDSHTTELTYSKYTTLPSTILGYSKTHFPAPEGKTVTEKIVLDDFTIPSTSPKELEIDIENLITESTDSTTKSQDTKTKVTHIEYTTKPISTFQDYYTIQMEDITKLDDFTLPIETSPASSLPSSSLLIPEETTHYTEEGNNESTTSQETELPTVKPSTLPALDTSHADITTSISLPTQTSPTTQTTFGEVSTQYTTELDQNTSPPPIETTQMTIMSLDSKTLPPTEQPMISTTPASQGKITIAPEISTTPFVTETIHASIMTPDTTTSPPLIETTQMTIMSLESKTLPPTDHPMISTTSASQGKITIAPEISTTPFVTEPFKASNMPLDTTASPPLVETTQMTMSFESKTLPPSEHPMMSTTSASQGITTTITPEMSTTPPATEPVHATTMTPDTTTSPSLVETTQMTSMLLEGKTLPPTDHTPISTTSASSQEKVTTTAPEISTTPSITEPVPTLTKIPDTTSPPLVETTQMTIMSFESKTLPPSEHTMMSTTSASQGITTTITPEMSTSPPETEPVHASTMTPDTTTSPPLMETTQMTTMSLESKTLPPTEHPMISTTSASQDKITKTPEITTTTSIIEPVPTLTKIPDTTSPPLVETTQMTIMSLESKTSPPTEHPMISTTPASQGKVTRIAPEISTTPPATEHIHASTMTPDTTTSPPLVETTQMTSTSLESKTLLPTDHTPISTISASQEKVTTIAPEISTSPSMTEPVPTSTMIPDTTISPPLKETTQRTTMSFESKTLPPSEHPMMSTTSASQGITTIITPEMSTTPPATEPIRASTMSPDTTTSAPLVETTQMTSMSLESKTLLPTEHTPISTTSASQEKVTTIAPEISTTPSITEPVPTSTIIPDTTSPPLVETTKMTSMSLESKTLPPTEHPMISTTPASQGKVTTIAPEISTSPPETEPVHASTMTPDTTTSPPLMETTQMTTMSLESKTLPPTEHPMISTTSASQDKITKTPEITTTTSIIEPVPTSTKIPDTTSPPLIETTQMTIMSLDSKTLPPSEHPLISTTSASQGKVTTIVPEISTTPPATEPILASTMTPDTTTSLLVESTQMPIETPKTHTLPENIPSLTTYDITQISTLIPMFAINNTETFSTLSSRSSEPTESLTRMPDNLTTPNNPMMMTPPPQNESTETFTTLLPQLSVKTTLSSNTKNGLNQSMSSRPAVTSTETTTSMMIPETTTSVVTTPSTTTTVRATTKTTTRRTTRLPSSTTRRRPTSKPTSTNRIPSVTRFMSTTPIYKASTIPLPPRAKQSKRRKPNNYYEYYLRRGHFPLCAAVLAFLRYLCEGFY